MDYVYKFPVVKGLQAGKEYYIGMVPLKMLSRLFVEEDDLLPPEFRAQRRLNLSRIPVISQYVLKNPDDYVFSALAASIDGEFVFKASYEDSQIGILEVAMDAQFLINDGQHRKAAILEALKENKDLGEETIPVVFFEDRGLKKSQQIFTDLNKHAVKTSNSISELYDSRDPIAAITRRVVSEVPFIKKYTDKEKDNLGKFSSKLFTFNTFYNANKKIVGKKKPVLEDEEFIVEFWKKIVKSMPLWQEMENRTISKTELRESYIVTQAVVIQAFGRLGNYYRNHKDSLTDIDLEKLQNIDWNRNADHWMHRTIKANGSILTGHEAIILTTNYIKKIMAIPLDDTEKKKEQNLNETRRDNGNGTRS